MPDHLNYDEFNNRHGWFNQEEGLALYEFGLKARTALEIGTWEGRSTYALCEGVWSAGGNGFVLSIDHFRGVPDSGVANPTGVYGNLANEREGVLKRFLSNTKIHRDLGLHFFLEADFDEVFPFLKLLFQHHPLDLAFVDDDHEYDTVKRRIDQCLQLLRPGGRLCGHDYRTAGNPGVQIAVDEMLPSRLVYPKTSIWLYDKPT